MTSAATANVITLGERLRYVRGHASQKERAAALAVALSTYQNYERDERVPDAEFLARVTREGWNGHWLLTGEGPERLEALSGAGFSGSQAVRVDGETLRDSVEAVDAALAAMNIDASGAERAALYSAMYEYLASGDASPGQATAAVLRIIQGGKR